MEKVKLRLAWVWLCEQQAKNIKVYVLQFLKGGSYTGEYIAASNFLPNITFKQFGKACIKEKNN